MSSTPKIRFMRLTETAKIPSRAHPTDAGLDLYSDEEKILESTNFGLFDVGISCEFPPGFGLFIWDRSGLAAKHGIHRLAGVIDCSYRGPIKVALVNLGKEPYTVKKGERIAQAILAPIAYPEIEVVESLSETERGQGGFGSTGR